MSPLPLNTTVRAIYTKDQESQKRYFYEREFGADDSMWLISPTSLKSYEYLYILGVSLVDPNVLTDNFSGVVESYHVIDLGRGNVSFVVHADVIYATNKKGFYVEFRYNPQGYNGGDYLKPILVHDPMMFNGGRVMRLGEQAEQRYLESVKGLPSWHEVRVR